MYRTATPATRRTTRRPCLASPRPSPASPSRRRSSVSSTFPAPTFTAVCLSFSLSRAPPPGEEGTLSQVMRAVHLARERESPVLQSRNGGPEGRSSVTLTESLPIFDAFQRTYRVHFPPWIRFRRPRRPFFLPPSCRRPRRLLATLVSLHACVCARAREFSAPQFCESESLIGGSWTDLQWCTCTLGLESHRRT